jgi:inositol-phosphate phosphatase/L-galactose 1-phosphate phosphatase/histidinol-phosphatase
MVQAAGGMVTGWQGEPLGIETTDRIVAAGDPKLHAEVIRLLNQT